jgi:hypothetical protein
MGLKPIKYREPQIGDLVRWPDRNLNDDNVFMFTGRITETIPIRNDVRIKIISCDNPDVVLDYDYPIGLMRNIDTLEILERCKK